MNFAKAAVAVFVAGTAIAAASVSSAASMVIELEANEAVSLDQLLGPDADAVQVGDKLFDNFAYEVSPLSGSTAPDPEFVNIVGLVEDGNFGIRIQAGFANFSSEPFITNIQVDFDVTVLDPTFVITSAEVQSNPASGGADPGLAEVSGFYFTTGDPLDNAEAFRVFDTPGPSEPVNTDSVVFDIGQSNVEVQQGITLFANPGLGGASAAATVSFVDHIFFQEVVPEPSTAMLMMLAAGLVPLRKRS